MFFNVVDLKPEVKVEDVELVVGEMCNVAKNNYEVFGTCRFFYDDTNEVGYEMLWQHVPD